MCRGGAWKGTSGQHNVTHFHEKCHRRPIWWKCVAGREKECALEGPGREVRRQAALRTSEKCATEGRSGGSALQGGRRNVPRRGLERHFGAARRYTLPRKVPQKAVRAEVRCRAGEGMCHGGAWEAGRLEVRTGTKDEKHPGCARRVPARTGLPPFRY